MWSADGSSWRKSDEKVGRHRRGTLSRSKRQHACFPSTANSPPVTSTIHRYKKLPTRLKINGNDVNNRIGPLAAFQPSKGSYPTHSLFRGACSLIR